jgi:hypothetical protein
MKTWLLIALGLFVLMLVIRFVRGIMQGKRISAGRTCSTDGTGDPELAGLIEEAHQGGKAREVLRKIEDRATSAANPESRASYHCAAGDVSLIQMKRPKVAVGFYLRALREDPTCVPAFDKLQEILLAQKRGRRFERTCWEVLGRLDDAEVGSEIWVKCWSGLAVHYSASPRHVGRADAIRALIAAVADGQESERDAGDAGSDDEDKQLPRVVS